MTSIQQSTSIDWLETQSIFSDPTQMLFDDPPRSVEHELPTMIARNYFQNIYTSLDNFKLDNYKFYCTNVEIEDSDNEQPALVKEWNGSNGERLQYWVAANDDTDDKGWGAIYDDGRNFVIVGNFNAHPFVLTSDFYFCNSDGSTYEGMDFPSFGIEHIAKWMKDKLVDYCFHQIH